MLEGTLAELATRSQVPVAVLRAVWMRETSSPGPDLADRAKDRVTDFVTLGPRSRDADIWPASADLAAAPRQFDDAFHPLDRQKRPLDTIGLDVTVYGTLDATVASARGVVTKLDNPDEITVRVCGVSTAGQGMFKTGETYKVPTAFVESGAVR